MSITKQRQVQLDQQSSWDRYALEAQEQAHATYILSRAKEILCNLWKQGKIDMCVRSEGDVALSAALWAVENPGAGKATKRIGALAAGEQWAKEQERSNAEF